ncbi:MAG: beta-L-arabinofuranosidase domain-containing protein [Mucilaginibacter sp.]
MKNFMLKASVITLVAVSAAQISFAQYIGQNTSEQKLAVKITNKASSFNLQDVQLLDSRFKQNMQRDGKLLLALDTKRLLHSWRINAGISSNAKAFGGWEALDVELRGHTLGHVMSALAMMYASTGEQAYKNKADTIVRALAECQDVLNQGGYLSAFPQNFIDRVIAGKNVWAPWYTIHKIMAGLTDLYIYTGDKKALAIVEKMSDWAYHKLQPLSKEQLAVMERNEFGGMIEVAYNLYAITGNEQDKRLAELFYDESVLNPLANQQDKLAGLHANTQIPKIIGEARGYELTGDDKQKTIAQFFWQTVIDHHTYATGGNSDNEHFFTPDQLSKHITPITTESCNTYNMLKLTRHLFTWTADEKYADYYEQALYNHILGTQDAETGMFTYFMSFKPGLFKVYSTADNSFWCCMGTGFENHAKYAESIYYHNDKGVFVNLFIPSVLNWKEKGLKLTQTTQYPEENTTHLTINESPAGNTTLYIRYPAWATDGATVKINGKVVKTEAKPGSYMVLDRKWKAGDKIDVTYPMALHLVKTNDDPNKAAIAYGPIVLAGDMGTEGITAPAPFARDQQNFKNYAIPASVISSLHANGQPVKTWVTPVANQPLTFQTKGVANRDITLLPYYAINKQRYVLYWDLQ